MTEHALAISFSHFTSGALALGLFVGALYFLHAYHCAKDRFFLFLMASFIVMAAERVVWGISGNSWFHDQQIGLRTIVYAIRLAGFAIIALGIIDKNTRFKQPTAKPELTIISNDRLQKRHGKRAVGNKL